MGTKDAQEMLEAAQKECIRLERENAEMRVMLATRVEASRLAQAKADALREFASMLAQGWRFNLDDLWKPKHNEVWVDWLRAEADRIEKEADRG